MRSMGSSSAGASADPLYALVSYIPGNLGTFLNRLRHDLVTTCSLQSHLTFLPPRYLSAPSDLLSKELDRRLAAVDAFPVTLGEIEVFESTNVVYIGLEQGASQVRDLHAWLAAGPLEYKEPFPFHPHVTLAQEFGPERLSSVVESARKAWAMIPASNRSFLIDRLVFVRNQDPNTWNTISEHDLQPLPLVRTA